MAQVSTAAPRWVRFSSGSLPRARHLPRNIIIIIIHLNPRSELEGARLFWRAGCVQHRGMSARQRGVAVVRSLALVLAFL